MCRDRLLSLCLGIACFGLLAPSGTAAGLPIPDRPAVMRASFKGEMLPVVAMRRQTPLVEHEGKRVPADHDAKVSLDVGYEYAPGMVAVQDAQVIGWYTEYSNDGASFFDAPKATQFRATLVAETDMEDVFLVMLVFDHRESLEMPVQCSVGAFAVGRLAANKPRIVTGTFPPIKGKGRWEWTAAVFSGPRQVRSHGVGNLLPEFFNAVEQQRYRVKLAERASGPDTPLVAFRQLPWKFSEEVQARFAGRRVVVRLRVDRDGELLDVTLKEVDDDCLLREVERTLQYWMFLPSIKEGRPVLDYANVMLQF